jgi:hypothetical protein
MSEEVSIVEHEEGGEPAAMSIDTVLDAALKEGLVVLMADGATIGSEAPEIREALIFRAGRYEDKGIEVTEADLDKYILYHKENGKVPICHEHKDGKLRFGYLVGMWRKGTELFGRLAFDAPALATAKKCGLQSLSVAIDRVKNYIKEVSLVEFPRIQDAGIEFSLSGEFSIAESPAAPMAQTGSDTKESEVTNMADAPNVQASEIGLAEARLAFAENKAAIESGELQRYSQDNIALAREARQMLSDQAKETAANNAEFRAQRAEMIVDDWKQRGHITRAVEAKVRALAQHIPAKGTTIREQDSVEFTAASGETEVAHWAQVFKEVIDANGPVVDLKERARAGETSIMSAEDAANAAKFNYTPEQAQAIIAKHEGGAA